MAKKLHIYTESDHPLRKWRVANNMTVSDMAERVGFVPSVISNIELRRRGTDWQTITAIADFTKRFRKVAPLTLDDFR